MGASNFSGDFAKNPDYFDGGNKQERDQNRVGAPDLYTLLKELAHKQLVMVKDAADGAAGTATAERAFWLADVHTKTVSSVKFVPGAALTADNANYATLIVRKRTAAGVDGGIVAQVTTQIAGGSGNWTAHVPVSIPLTTQVASSRFDLLTGESLTFEITKTGIGVVVPVGALVVNAD